MANQLQHSVCRKTGLWLAVGTVLFVAGWRLVVIACQPPHIMDIATEIGSIAEFGQGSSQGGSGILFPNNGGTALTFFRMTETGLGSYFCNAGAGGCKLLFELSEDGYDLNFGMLGWSSDDKFFACLVPTKPDRSKKEILIYDGATGERRAGIPGQNYFGYSRFVWLSPRSFIYTSQNQNLILVEQSPDGQWLQRLGGSLRGLFAKEPPDDAMKHLLATSEHSFAWQQPGELWTYDLQSGAGGKIWESATEQLEDFSFDQETGEFELTCAVYDSPYHYHAADLIFYRLRPPDKSLSRDGRLTRIPRDSRLRYADLSEDEGLYVFSIKAHRDSKPQLFTWEGMVQTYKLAGNSFFFTANLPGQPPALWCYDLDAQDARELVPSTKEQLKYAQISNPSGGTVTNAMGDRVRYHLWQPPQVSPGRKYPLLIGQTQYSFDAWFPCQQVAVNAGFYFATADRLSWYDGFDKWEPDVMALYDLLVKNPCIDTNRIYICGLSGETHLVPRLIADKPDLWKGAVLFELVARMPDVSKSHLTRIFAVSGRVVYTGDVPQILKGEDESARAGVPVQLVLQDGVQHFMRSIATERERTRQFAHFLVESE